MTGTAAFTQCWQIGKTRNNSRSKILQDMCCGFFSCPFKPGVTYMSTTYVYSLVHNKILVLTWVLAYSCCCLSILCRYKYSQSELLSVVHWIGEEVLIKLVFWNTSSWNPAHISWGHFLPFHCNSQLYIIEWSINAIKITFQRKCSLQGSSQLRLVRTTPWSLANIPLWVCLFKAWFTILFFLDKVNWGYWFLLKWYSNLCLLNIHQLAVSRSKKHLSLLRQSVEWKKNGGGVAG